MYIPAFVPCPICLTGPILERNAEGGLYGFCFCCYVSTKGRGDEMGPWIVNPSDDEIQAFNIDWNVEAQEMTRIHGVDSK